MKKDYPRWIVVSIILILVIVVIVIVNSNSDSDISEVCIEDKECFSVELAETVEERRIGLSEHEFLEDGSGMLFIFEEEIIPGFWMKDMDFSIDIIWISSEFEIVGIEENLQPCVEDPCQVYRPEEQVKYVLEINSGLSEDLGFGDRDMVFLK